VLYTAAASGLARQTTNSKPGELQWVKATESEIESSVDEQQPIPKQQPIP